jgi:glucose-6-phosphate 1-epimerase
MDPRIEIGPGRDGMQRLELIYDESNSSEIYLNGAHVTSWRSEGEEILFLSEQSRFSVGKPIRGGIPLVFPQFGPGKLPQHGFARSSLWEIASTRVAESGEVEVVLALNNSDTTREVWDHAFRAEFVVSVTDRLRTELRVTNSNTVVFEFTAALHTYFAIADIGSAHIAGLKGLDYLDSLKKRQKLKETEEKVIFEGEVDRIYLSTPDEVSVVDEAKGRCIKIQKSGFPDAVVWNPWVDKARRMQDFGDEEYRGMVCVEAGAVASPVVLEPGGTWHGTQTLTLGGSGA